MEMITQKMIGIVENIRKLYGQSLIFRAAVTVVVVAAALLCTYKCGVIFGHFLRNLGI